MVSRRVHVSEENQSVAMSAPRKVNQSKSNLLYLNSKQPHPGKEKMECLFFVVILGKVYWFLVASE